MRNGLEGVFDLVESTLWGEDGGLIHQRHRLAGAAVKGPNGLTRESYRRDMVHISKNAKRSEDEGIEKIVEEGSGDEGRSEVQMELQEVPGNSPWRVLCHPSAKLGPPHHTEASSQLLL